MNLRTTIKQNPIASFIILTLGLSFAAMLLPVPPESGFAAVVQLLDWHLWFARPAAVQVAEALPTTT